jgi:hypothetical protein
MAKKIAFPNRACPKCGKAIHIKTKQHDCGWKAEGSAEASPATKLQAKHSPTATNGQKLSKPAPTGEKLSKMEAVRRILKEHGKETMPLDIQTMLKKEYKITMDVSVISNYKGTILKAKKKIGRPKGPKAWSPKTAPDQSTGEITMSDIEAVKTLVDSIGADKVKALAQVLAK